ncbi:hypothetical protein LXL04_006515 [Taraxacum kok-saghyz]
MVVVEMATKAVYKQREDKKELQKQFGCMNGIFQLFDRRYLLGLHRHGRNQKMLTSGQGGNDENGFKNSLEKVKEKNTRGVMIEKNRASIESPRNSCSSSSSSTIFSSLDCSKRGHTMELLQLPSEPTSPYLQRNQIRDVVKNSMMTRTIHVATSDKNVQKELKHVDSPRPILVRQKSIEYDRKDTNLAKEKSRFSCDERESKLKSTLKVKEVPRLSLDSKQNSNNAVEPGSNKRPSSGVVARLMGLEGFSFTDSIVEVETLKIKKPILDQELVSRFKKMEGKKGSFSVYGEMEKRLSGIEFKASGKDLRALKQILEAIKNKEQSFDTEKIVKPVSVMVKGTRREPVNREVKPAKLTKVKVNHDETKNDFCGRKKVKDSTPQKTNVTNSPKKLTADRPVLKKSKKVSSPLTRVKKQPNTKIPKTKTNDESHVETRNDNPKKDHKNDFVKRLMEEEDKPIVELPKVTIEQQSPVSVLDVFYSEDTPSPIKNKSTTFNDYEPSHFDERHETEWSQEGIIYLHDLNIFNPINEDHKYINEILLTSDFLKDLDSAIRIVQINPTGSLIKPELFHFLEKKQQYIDLDKTNKKSKRKLIFDSVNEILHHKLLIQGSFGVWSRKRSLNGENLLKELLSEIDNLQNAPERYVYDEDDEVKNLVSVDVNKSEDWDTCCNEVSSVVLDIERLIFKDLIDEVVNAEVAQSRPRRRCRNDVKETTIPKPHKTTSIGQVI